MNLYRDNSEYSVIIAKLLNGIIDSGYSTNISWKLLRAIPIIRDDTTIMEKLRNIASVTREPPGGISENPTTRYLESIMPYVVNKIEMTSQRYDIINNMLQYWLQNKKSLATSLLHIQSGNLKIDSTIIAHHITVLVYKNNEMESDNETLKDVIFSNTRSLITALSSGIEKRHYVFKTGTIRALEDDKQIIYNYSEMAGLFHSVHDIILLLQLKTYAIDTLLVSIHEIINIIAHMMRVLPYNRIGIQGLGIKRGIAGITLLHLAYQGNPVSKWILRNGEWHLKQWLDLNKDSKMLLKEPIRENLDMMFNCIGFATKDFNPIALCAISQFVVLRPPSSPDSVRFPGTHHIGTCERNYRTGLLSC